MQDDELQELDAIVLIRDLPEFRLRAGDLGGIVATEDDGRFIIEVPDSAGGTYALLTIETSDLRRATDDEIERGGRPDPLPDGQHVLIAHVKKASNVQPTPRYDDTSFEAGLRPGSPRPAARLSHIDDSGRARMVDVTAKDETVRVGVARGRVVMQPRTLQLLLAGEIAKGNVLTTAQIAGVMAAKKTHELIPMCHPLLLTGIDVELEPDEANSAVEITASVRTTGKTGVEMEALTAVTVAGLTIYDMCKAVDRAMRLEDVRVVSKSGGASGDYRAE